MTKASMPYRPFSRPTPTRTAIRYERPPLRFWQVLGLALVASWVLVILVVWIVAAVLESAFNAL